MQSAHGERPVGFLIAPAKFAAVRRFLQFPQSKTRSHIETRRHRRMVLAKMYRCAIRLRPIKTFQKCEDSYFQIILSGLGSSLSKQARCTGVDMRPAVAVQGTIIRTVHW